MGRGPGIRAASASSVQIDFRYRGVRCREKLRLDPSPANLRYAARLKARIEHEIAVGTFDYAHHFPDSARARALARNPAAAITVGELLTEWLKSARATLEPETYGDYSEYVEHTWRERFGKTRLCDLTFAKVDEWISEQPTSRKRILNVLTPLRQAMRYAVKQKLLAVDPLATLRVQRPQSATEDDVVDPFQPAELAAIVAQLHPSTANAAEFWVWTGVREGELFGLTWSDVDLEKGTVRIAKAVRAGRTKAPKTKQGLRTIRLLPPALEALKRQQLQTRLMGRQVFLNPAWRPQAGSRWHQPKPGPWSEKKLREAWVTACAAAGVRYRPPRQCRHTFASWTLSAGEPVQWVSRMMGHANSAITQRVYARFIPDVFPDAGSRTLAAVRGKTA